MAINTNNLYNQKFRQKVINLDQGSLAKLVGASSSNIKVEVVKSTKETYYIVIPENPSTAELANIQAAGTSTLGTVCLTLSTWNAWAPRYSNT